MAHAASKSLRQVAQRKLSFFIGQWVFLLPESVDHDQALLGALPAHCLSLQGVLRELKACHVSGLKQLVLHLPSTHPLSSLDLSQCHFLQLLDLHLAGLTTLNLSACRTLYRLRMRCVAVSNTTWLLDACSL